MRSVLHAPAPSTTLLKFLKAQSEAICYFSPNPHPCSILDQTRVQGSHLNSFPISGSSKASSRCISTIIPHHATHEASFLNLDFLWPRAASSTPSPQSTLYPFSSRNKGLNDLKILQAQRKSSTGSQKWLGKLWGTKSAKGGRPLRPDDLPISLRGRQDEADSSVFSLGRAVSAKAAAQPKLRCTELDENGNVVLASGEFKKSELIAKVHIHLSYDLPSD